MTNCGRCLNVVVVMRCAPTLLVFATLFAPSCGSGFYGDCSGGRFEDGRCVNTQPAVHWTATRAAAAADKFTYAPMVRGKLSNARCRIVDRRPAFEATADCKATFTAPGRQPRRVRVVFDLSGIGAVNVDCDRPQPRDPLSNGSAHTPEVLILGHTDVPAVVGWKPVRVTCASHGLEVRGVTWILAAPNSSSRSGIEALA